MHGIIYLATFPNGKMYVGQTICDLEHRKNQHKNEAGRGEGSTFHKAINKYGFNNIKWEIIDSGNNQKELDNKEKHYIKQYRTFTGYKNCQGYNRTLGGEGVRGLIHSKDTRTKISNSLKGKLAGDNNPSARKVICLNTGEVFNTMKEASNRYKAPYHHICSCCTGDRLSSGIDENGNKLVWMYYKDYKKLTKEEIAEKIKYAEESRLGENHHFYNTGMSKESKVKMSESAIKRYQKSEHPRNRKVKCITTSEMFDSIMDASRCYNIHRTTISQCCSGTRKSAGKHPLTNEMMIWEYVN